MITLLMAASRPWLRGLAGCDFQNVNRICSVGNRTSAGQGRLGSKGDDKHADDEWLQAQTHALNVQTTTRSCFYCEVYDDPVYWIRYDGYFLNLHDPS